LYIVRNDWRRNNVQVTSFFEEINEGVADTIAAPCGFFLHLWGTLRERDEWKSCKQEKEKKTSSKHYLCTCSAPEADKAREMTRKGAMTREKRRSR
jgi:hypothetical protein